MPDTEFALPDLGEGLTEATIVEWLVGVGDTIRVDQPVVEVETAKARVEVPAPFTGVVATLHAQVGDTVPVGAALLTADVRADESGRVLVGYGPSAPARSHRRSRPTATAPTTSDTTGSNRPVISPLVRRLARERGIDIARLPGSGPHGTLLRRDVEAAASGKRVPLRGMRKVAAERYARSRREIPEATVWVDVDATGMLEARAALNAARPDEPVSLLGLLARFAVLGLRRFPELNARIEQDALVLVDEVHLGFAAQTDQGLIVPVVKNAHTLTTRELAAAISAHAADARSGATAPGTLRGGTFTVNNYGVFGVDGSAAIINHPEVAILGMGRIIDRPWAVDGQLAVRNVTQLTLAFDHRACDGAAAGGFLRFVADCVESPLSALGDL